VITLETVREYVENRKGTISEEHWLLLETFVDKLILKIKHHAQYTRCYTY